MLEGWLRRDAWASTNAQLGRVVLASCSESPDASSC